MDDIVSSIINAERNAQELVRQARGEAEALSAKSAEEAEQLRRSIIAAARRDALILMEEVASSTDQEKKIELTRARDRLQIELSPTAQEIATAVTAVVACIRRP